MKGGKRRGGEERGGLFATIICEQLLAVSAIQTHICTKNKQYSNRKSAYSSIR